MKARYCSFITFLLVFIIFTCLSPGFSQNSKLKDGIYTGEFSTKVSVKVKVTIKNHRITDIMIVEHSGSVIGENAEKPLINSILDNQSTDVNAITGATYSSKALKNAVDKALDKARQ